MDLTVKKSSPKMQDSQPSSTVMQTEEQATSTSKEVSKINESDIYNQLLARYLFLNPSLIGRNLALSLPYILSHSHSALNVLSSLPPDGLSSSVDEIEKSSVTESSTITSNMDLDLSGERKRISRPLTGRYVRHGTGASPSTLMSLRRMLQEKIQRRQSLKPGTQTRIKGRSRKRR